MTGCEELVLEMTLGYQLGWFIWENITGSQDTEFLRKAHVHVCMCVIFICKTHLSRACDCVHHSCASVRVNDCASVHVHVHGCDHVHGCVSVHDLSIKIQVQYIIYINLLVTRKQFL